MAAVAAERLLGAALACLGGGLRVSAWAGVVGLPLEFRWLGGRSARRFVEELAGARLSLLVLSKSVELLLTWGGAIELCMFENMSGVLEEMLEIEDVTEDGEGGEEGSVKKSVLTDGEELFSDSTNLPKEQKQQRPTGQSPPHSTTDLWICPSHLKQYSSH